VTVDQNVTVDFNPPTPTCSGDPDLCAFFTPAKNASTADTWKAIFELGTQRLLVKSGVKVTLALVNGRSPGLEIRSACQVEVEQGGSVVVASLNQLAGDILIRADCGATINGTVSNSVGGTLGLPGDITIATCSGDIVSGPKSLIQTIGVDPGGSDINLLACCEGGDITLNGLVMARGKAHTSGPRPNVRVAAFAGSVTVNGDSVEPFLDDVVVGGTAYDIFPGLLSWVTDSSNPGRVEVQARDDVTVRGHGPDPTGSVRTSFGAIAAGTGTSNSQGGLVDVRSLNGSIIGFDRAFQSFGRYNASARIRLLAATDLSITRPGATNGFNPVVDSASSGGGPGGTNELRAYQGSITIGTNAVVSATGTTPGTNLLTACAGVTNNGTVNPADAVTGDDSNVCVPVAPTAMFTGCGQFLPP
jgi:hypothetical protein